MTSAFMLKERIKQRDRWTFELSGNDTMRGQDDHYLRPYERCHPDYMEIPIGNPYGVKVCVRKVQPNGKRVGDYSDVLKDADKNNGYYRGSVNLYNPCQKYPTQKWNPQNYSDRRIPWEQDLLRDDYLRLPIKYDATGIRLLNQPAELNESNNNQKYKGFYKYGYSFTPKEDKDTGMRVPGAQSRPELKYDVTRPYPQPYELWKSEQKSVGERQRPDIRYNKRII
jgi:hypothetical protein